MDLQHIQRRTMEILDAAKAGDKASLWCDRFLSLVIILSIVEVVLESVPGIQAQWSHVFDWSERVMVLIFTVEYVLRIWSTGARYQADGDAWRGRREYLLSGPGIVDLLAILPFYLSALVPGLDLRVLRAIRLVRILKLSHYNSAIEDLFSAIAAERHSFLAAMYLLALAILLTSTGMYFAETDVQPEKFSSIPAAMYWSIITLTTVGYGDVSPVTPLGQIISVLTAFLGVSTVALLTGIVASAFANQMARRRVIIEAELRQALSDGTLSLEEREKLEQLRKSFHLTIEQMQSIEREVRAETESKV